MKHVAVGVDGSSVASDALMWAADVATKVDAEVAAHPRRALLSMAEVGVALKVLHHASVPLVLVPGG
jgi:nucleotide-binding universal stress UspA family protein